MNEDVTIISNIKAALEKAGFETKWRSPFWEWVHPECRGNDDIERHDGSRLYVAGLPVPAGIPFDLAEVEISIHDNRLYFSFTLYFYAVLKDAIEVEDFRKIHEQHDLEWFPSLRIFYLDVASRFGLQWDIEYDESIEDSLCRYFRTDEWHKVIDLVQTLDGHLARQEN